MSDKPVGAENQPERDQVAREVAERLDRESFETDGGPPAVYLKTAIEALIDSELECRRLREALTEVRKKAFQEVEAFIAENGRNADIQSFVERKICAEEKPR